MSTPRGTGCLLGHEGLGVAQSSLQTAAAQERRDGFAQLQAAEWVNERVHGRVEHGHGNDPFRIEECAAITRVAEEVHQQEDEQRTPTHHEDSNDGDDGLQEAQWTLAAACGSGLSATADVAVDGEIESADCEKHYEEYNQGEQDVALGVERQQCGATS